MSEKKYELTSETKNISGRTLHRIKALKDFGDVKAGDLGGWVEKEENLSQEGTCWVYNEAKVYGDARVCHDARVCGNSKVYIKARVMNDATIHGYAQVFDKAIVKDYAYISDDAHIYENATVGGYASVHDQAKIRGNTYILKNINIGGKSRFSRTPINSIVIGPIGSRNDYVTFYTAEDMQIWVETGCFIGTLKEFKLAAKRRHKSPNPVFYKEYMQAIKMAKSVLGLKTGSRYDLF